YPVYFVYCALYIYFYHNFLGTPLLSIEELIGALLLIPGYSSKIIGPGWTLAFEVYFYLCFSVAMTLGLKKGLYTLTAFFLISILLPFFIDTSAQANFVVTGAWISYATNTLLVEFLLGAWIGYGIVTNVYLGNVTAISLVALGIAGFSGGIIFGFARLPS